MYRQSYNFALALKNQILFTAKKHPSVTKEKYQEVIDKYNLQLSPKTLEEVKGMNLADYRINIENKMGQKRYADFFEALIGAIYIDSGEDGFSKVYEFLYNNFKEEFLAM